MESMYYDFKKPGYNKKTSSFTQLVWKNTKKVGFGFATAKNEDDIIIALYDPKGNIDGQF